MTFEIKDLKHLINFLYLKNKFYEKVMKENDIKAIIDWKSIDFDFFNDLEQKYISKNLIMKKPYTSFGNDMALVIENCKKISKKETSTPKDEFYIEDSEDEYDPIGYLGDFERKDKTNGYKPIKINNLFREEPTPLELELHIQTVKDSKEQKDINVYIEKFEKTIIGFLPLRDNSVYSTSTLSTKIKKINYNLILNCSSPHEYIKILNNNLIKLRLLLDMKHDPKVVDTIINNSLNWLDMRLLEHKDRIISRVDINEFKNLYSFIKSNVVYEEKFRPYKVDYNTIFSNYITNVLLSMTQIIQIYFLNEYGFNNIIYIPINESSDDPYSFYYLVKIDNGVRYWKMDCRLEDICLDFVSNYKPRLISTFRNLYFEIYKDNIYRSNCDEAISEDLNQILYNLNKVSDFYNVCNHFRDIIKKHSTYIPTENDRFNLCNDDLLQKKRFETKSENGLLETIDLLFDCISIEDAQEYIRIKIEEY